MTEYIHRVTIAVPESMIPDANQLAVVIGESAADVNTFGVADYVTPDGHRYAVASTVAKPIFIELANNPLVAPDHAPEADIEAAGRAQAAVIIAGEEVPTLDGTAIVAIVDVEPLAAIEMMGLTQYDTEVVA